MWGQEGPPKCLWLIASVQGVLSCVTIALKTSDHTIIIIIIIIIIILACYILGGGFLLSPDLNNRSQWFIPAL